LLRSAIGVGITDKNGRFAFVNDAFCRVTGYTQEELQSSDWISITHPDDLELSRAAIQQIRSRQLPSVLFEKRYLRKDGTPVWVRKTISVLQEASGEPEYFIAFMEDITERKRTAEALAEKVWELRQAQRLAQVGNWTWDPATDVVTWSEELYRATGVDPKLPAPLFRQHSRFFTPDSWNLLTRAVAETLRTGEPYRLELEAIVSKGARRAIVSRGEAVKDARGRVVRLRGTIHDITERKQAEEHLQRRNYYIETILENAPVGFAVVSVPDGTFVFLGSKFEEIHGLAQESVATLGEFFQSFQINADNATEIKDRVLADIAGGRPSRLSFENLPITTAAGEHKFISISQIPIPGQELLVCAVQDVSERWRAELAARKSEEKFAKLFQSSPVAMTLVTAKEGRRIAVNDAYEQLIGRPREEIIGRTYLELGRWDDPRDREQLVARILAEGGIRNVECRLRNKRGELFIGLLSADKIEIDGEMCLLTAVADITEWKRTEQALRMSQTKLALHSEQTMFGIIEWDSALRVHEWNPAAAAIFGYTREQALGRHARDFLAPPSTASRLLAALDELFSETGGCFSTQEHPAPDGRTIFCKWFTTPMFEENGKVAGFMSLIHDITAETRAQAELAASQATLSALIESTDDMIWAVDADRFGFTTFNSALASYFARHRGLEIRPGMTPDEISSEYAPWWNQAYRRARDAGSYQTEYAVPSTDRILHLSFNPLVRNRQVFGISIFGRDITERRQAEDALRESETRLRLAAEAGRMYAFEWDAATDLVQRSAECFDILGMTSATLPKTLKGIMSYLTPPDRERYANTIAALTPDKPSARIALRFRRPDGNTIWIEGRIRGFFDASGSLVRMVGMGADMTARKEGEERLIELGGRLITVLEEERMRVARELHDGVSQQLAVVSIELAQAARKGPAANLGNQLDKLYDKLQDVLSEIGSLSHQLHPSTLKHLGFSPAIRNLCREVSEAHGIEVQFSDKDVPEPVPNEVALCLYRVAQEVLRNTVKHSQSKIAWVQLTGTPQGLRLRIWDEGTGFDTEVARSGLGLLSMRERVRLVGGSLRIESHVGSGTCIEVTVPLKQEL
jgi:PAS domain S-box-containing protein